MTLSRLLPWLLIPVALLSAATFVKLPNVLLPLQPGVLATLGDGTAHIAQVIGATLSSNGGNLTLTIPSAGPAAPPTVVLTHVTASTPNSFACPAGKAPYLVSKNIPQGLGEDYTIATDSGAVVFNVTPLVDDVVQLACW